MSKVKLLTSFGLEAAKRFMFPQMSHITLSMTNRCNQRCLTCGIWQIELKQDIKPQDVAFLLDANNIMWITLTGGEPSLSPYFPRILNLCLKSCKLVQLNTNGYLTSWIIQAIHDALTDSKDSLLVVSVSLFGNKPIHTLITRTDRSYLNAVSTLEQLRKIASDRLLVGLAHTVSRYNVKEYLHIEELAEYYDVGVTYAWERHAPFYNNSNGEVFSPELPEPVFSLNPLSLFKNAFLSNPTRKGGCVASEYSCWVTPDLSVFPCMWAIPFAPAFNLQNTGYRVDKNRFSETKEWVRRCPGCWIACQTYETLIWRPWRVLK